MTIAIGQELDSDFHNPLGLLSDCHRRIERFLDELIRISESARENRLVNAQREQVEVALRYFREAAPKHTLDEEESLFPRLKSKLCNRSQANFSLLDRLHTDHAQAEMKHRAVDELCRAWLTDGVLAPDSAQELSRLLRELRTTYEKHIGVEDDEVFPLAKIVLDESELEDIGQEMAYRRGLLKSGRPSR